MISYSEWNNLALSTLLLRAEIKQQEGNPLCVQGNTFTFSDSMMLEAYAD